MKTYEKPRLMALSLTSNDLLCGNCENEVDELIKDIVGDVQLFNDYTSCEKTPEDLKNLGLDDTDCKFIASNVNMYS